MNLPNRSRLKIFFFFLEIFNSIKHPHPKNHIYFFLWSFKVYSFWNSSHQLSFYLTPPPPRNHYSTPPYDFSWKDRTRNSGHAYSTHRPHELRSPSPFYKFLDRLLPWCIISLTLKEKKRKNSNNKIIEDEQGVSPRNYGGGGNVISWSKSVTSGDLQPRAVEPMPTSNLVLFTAINYLLQQIEGAEALSLWISQGSSPQAVCVLSWC